MRKTDYKVALIVPVYNEHETVETFVQTVNEKLEKELEHIEIVFIDDGSKDNTLKNIFSSEEKEVYELERLRFIDERPAMCITTYVPASIFSNIDKYDFSSVSLYKTMSEEYKINIYYADKEFRVIAAGKEDAQKLKLKVGSPLQEVRTITYDDNNRINGILFDGAWLWEEYLNVLLQNLGFRHPENKLGMGAIYLFEQGGQRYPDFWKEDIVLDAKYKRLAQNGNRLDVDRNDIHQVMAYMYRLKASKGGIICPFIGARNKVISEKMHRDSYKGTLSLYTLAVPSGCESYSEFVGKMHKNELDFIQTIVK